MNQVVANMAHCYTVDFLLPAPVAEFFCKTVIAVGANLGCKHRKKLV
jgi:hypothetical protein